MMNKKLVPVEKFMEVALANGYEVFDEAQVAAYAKDFMTKSQAGEVLQEDKAEFAVEMVGLQKAICANEDGSQCTLYYRKPLVDWKVDSNGLVMKGIAGTYTDTPENRKLNRVGQAYVASPDVIKAIYGDIEKSVKEDEAVVDAELAKQADSIKKSCLVVTADADRRLALGEIDEALCKSVKDDINLYLTSWGDTLDECCDVVKSEDLADVREDLADATAAFADIVKAAHGRYADNAKNRRLHRVGQEYGKAAQKENKDEKKQGVADDESGEKPSRNGDSVKRDISILEENKDRIVEKYGQEAYDKKIEALKKEGEDFEQKETVKQLKERADKQDAEEEERKKAEKRAKRQERRRARHAAKREAAKKAKEEAEAKAKAEAEEKQEPEKKKQESSEDDTKKKVRDFIKNGLDGAVDSAMKRFVADFYGGKGEHLNASDYVNSGDFQEYLRKYLPAGITTEDLKGAVVSSVNRGIERRNGIEREEKLKEFKRLEALRDGATAKEAEDFANKVYADTIGRADRGDKDALAAFNNAKFVADKDAQKHVALLATKAGAKKFLSGKVGDDYYRAVAEVYDAFRQVGKNKKITTILKEVGSGNPSKDMRARKYVEAVNAGASPEEAKEFAQKTFETLNHDIEVAQAAMNGGHPQGMTDYLLKKAYDAFDKAKFTKNEPQAAKSEEDKLKTSKIDEAKKAGASSEEAKAFVDKLYADTIARAEKEYKRDLEDGKLPYGAEDYQKKYAREAFDNAKFEKDKKDYGYMDKGDVEYIMDDASVQYADIDELLSTIKEHGISSDPDEMMQGAISTEFSGDAFAHEASVLIPGLYNRVGMQQALKGKQPKKFYSLNLKLKNGRTLRDFNMGRVTRDDIESAHLQVNHPKDNTYTIEREKINLDKVPVRAF